MMDVYLQKSSFKYSTHCLRVFDSLRPKALGFARVTWSWRKSSQGKSKLTRNLVFTVKLLNQ